MLQISLTSEVAKGLPQTAAIAELRSMGSPLITGVKEATEVTGAGFELIGLLGEVVKNLDFKEAALWTEG